MQLRCFCECHRCPDLEYYNKELERGIDTSDVVEAASACDTCRDKHVLAVFPEFYPRPRAVNIPYPEASTYKPPTKWKPPQPEANEDGN